MLFLQRFALPSLVVSTALSAYIALYAGGTFLQDDFAQIASSSLTFDQQIESWLPLWGIRPVSLVLMTALIQLFGTEWGAYLLVNLALFLVAVWAFFLKSHPFRSETSKWMAFGAALMPAMASSLVFSPVNQISASLSLAFAGVGHVILSSERLKSEFRCLLAGVAFSASLMAYEVSLPLMVWSVLSKAATADKLRLTQWRYLAKVSLPLTASLALVVSWQKLLAPNLLEATDSRLASFSLLAGLTWLYALLVSLLPQLLTAAALAPELFLGMSIITGFLLWLHSKYQPKDSVQKKAMLLAAFIALGSSSLLFIGSGHAADMNGYLNRGLSSTWLVLVISLTLVLERDSNLRKLFGAVGVLFFSSNFAWFALKVEENITASRIRVQIVQELLSNSTQFPEKVALLVDSPCLVPGGRFDTEIFCSSWDLKGALSAGGLELSYVQPLWDASFRTNSPISEAGQSTLLLRFDDSGYLISTHVTSTHEINANPFQRSPGGRDFKALDCLNLLDGALDEKPEPTIIQCLMNPL